MIIWNGIYTTILDYECARNGAGWMELTEHLKLMQLYLIMIIYIYV